MATKCFPLVGGRVMRVSRLDGCGRISTEDPACQQVTSDGFVSVEVTANVDEGDEISVTNAAGKVCVSQTPCPTLTGYSVNVTFCAVDTDLFAMMSGQRAILDPGSGDSIGFRVNTGRSGCDHGFALEIWSSVPGISCPVDDQGQPIVGATQPSGYILFPFLQGGVFGDFTIENDAVSFVVQNAATKDGSGWGTGPYDVTLDAGGQAGPLSEPIDAKDHMHVQITFVEPPKPGCGCHSTDPATGADAGTPGDWTPTGAIPPYDLAELRAGTITATPTTAWTSGQFVSLGDGSNAHWDSDSWEAGKAP